MIPPMDPKFGSLGSGVGFAPQLPARSYAYLYDDAAVDVSRMTGIPWGFAKTTNKEAPRPFISLLDLGYWDRLRVAWAVIGMSHYLGEVAA